MIGTSQQIEHLKPTPLSVAELPLAPLNWRTMYTSLQFYLAFTGWIADPGLRMRDTGEIFRGIPVKLPEPLRLLIEDSFVDGWRGESVFVNSPRLVAELFGLPPDQVDHEVWKKFLLFLLGNQSPFVLGGRDHVRVRRAFATELTPARVEQYRQGSVERLDEMIDELPLNTPIALHDFYTRFTQDIILRVAFGWNDCRDLDELKAALYEVDQYYAAPTARRLGAFMLNSAISLRRGDGPLDISRRNDLLSPRWAPKGHQLRARTDELIHRKIKELRTRPNDSVVSRIIEYGAREDPAWTDKRLRDIVATLLVAGHDTSVLAYAWATQYLLHNPEPREKVIDEARAARTDRYAQAVNTESLRMQSPVIATLPWPIYQDISLGGYRIRKDTMILVPVTAVHYDEKLYPEPEKFRPERFLDTKPDRYGFIPFGAGAHRCPGSTFYLTEASILLHRIFGRLDLEPCDSGVDEARFVFGSVSRPKGDTRVILRHRRNAAEVPWYRPSPGEQLTPLKEALLPPQAGSDSPSHCPFSGTQEPM